MRRDKRLYPPNCTVCDLNASRFLAFREKQREVEAEYGFRLGVRRTTEEQKSGYRRYMRDYRRRYQEAHREQLKAYRRAYWINVTKRGFGNLAEARGDEAALRRRAERKAEKQKRAEYEARKREIHDKYGFWLGRKPQTPEEIAGRARYSKDWRTAYTAANKERIQACRRERSKRDRVRKEQEFLEKYHALLAVDPAKAEDMRRKRETLCLIQNMTHEERVRYRQQKQDVCRKARAEREAVRRAEREARRKEREEERKRLKRERSEVVCKAKRLAKNHARYEAWLARCVESRANAAAAAETVRRQQAAFAAEREANRAAYIAAKAAMRERERGMRDEKELPVALVPPVLPVPEVPSHPSAPIPHPLSAVIAADLPHHPFRGMSLEETAPTDMELADDSFSSPIPHTSSLSSVGGSTPGEPPTTDGGVTTGGEPPDDDGDEERRREREERIRRIREKYGFTLGRQPQTPEEIEGKKRYIADRTREAAIRNREIDFMLHGKERARKAAAKKRKATIARKKREAAAQAEREAKKTARAAKQAQREAERKARKEARQAARKTKQEAIEAAAAEKAEREALLEQAYTVFAYKVRAWENKKEKMRKSLGLPKMKRDFTPEQRETWNTYLREGRAELENWLVERMRKEAAKASKAVRSKAQPPAEIIAAQQERAREREERKRLIREKYGFTLGKKPVTPEEIEGRKRYDRDKEAESRKRHHDRITEYNREYRRRKRQRRWQRRRRSGRMSNGLSGGSVRKRRSAAHPHGSCARSPSFSRQSAISRWTT